MLYGAVRVVSLEAHRVCKRIAFDILLAKSVLPIVNTEFKIDS